MRSFHIHRLSERDCGIILTGHFVGVERTGGAGFVKQPVNGGKLYDNDTSGRRAGAAGQNV